MEKKKYYRYENQADGYNNFILVEKMLYSAGKNFFESKLEARNHYVESNRIACEKHKQIMSAINEVKEKIGNFEYNYYMCGDTHGIYDDGLFIEFDVNGYCFKFSQNRN